MLIESVCLCPPSVLCTQPPSQGPRSSRGPSPAHRLTAIAAATALPRPSSIGGRWLQVPVAGSKLSAELRNWLSALQPPKTYTFPATVAATAQCRPTDMGARTSHTKSCVRRHSTDSNTELCVPPQMKSQAPMQDAAAPLRLSTMGGTARHRPVEGSKRSTEFSGVCMRPEEPPQAYRAPPTAQTAGYCRGSSIPDNSSHRSSRGV
mmetsp:Transcript_53140/g.152237  ORF Transcript_53140/g.152237 Transcript_53140/m.152237 type:complete len:206 (+) Transcript_53140:12-629(+)